MGEGELVGRPVQPEAAASDGVLTDEMSERLDRAVEMRTRLGVSLTKVQEARVRLSAAQNYARWPGGEIWQSYLLAIGETWEYERAR